MAAFKLPLTEKQKLSSQVSEINYQQVLKVLKNIIVNRVGVLAEMIITMDHVRPSGSTHTKYLFMQ